MPRVVLATFSIHIRAHFLATGEFITVQPRSIADRCALKALPVDMPAWQFPVTIVTLKHRTLSPVAERFIACAREVLKSTCEPSAEKLRRPPGGTGRQAAS